MFDPDKRLMAIDLVLTDAVDGATYETAELTCDHPSSSHGIPVLVVGGNAYGAADKLPTRFKGGITAWDSVNASINFGRTAKGDPLANKFLDSFRPEISQVQSVKPEGNPFR
jgi:hypothetical protein